jgi:TolA-binding protein
LMVEEAKRAAAAAKAEEAPKAEQAQTPEPPKTPEPPATAEAAKAAEPAKTEAKPSADKELAFLQEAALSKDTDALKPAVAALEAFVDGHADTSLAPEALAELAKLQERLSDSASLVSWLRLIYEFPAAPLAGDARSAFLAGCNARLGRKLKEAAVEIAAPSDAADRGERLIVLAERLSGKLGDSLHGPALALAASIERRYPEHAAGDRLALAEGKLYEQGEDWQGALLSYRKLLTLYPSSPLRPQALWAQGALLAERVKDHRAAAAVFRQLADSYQQSPEALPALERAAQLTADKLKQPEQAVETYKVLVQRYPGTEAARRGLEAQAKLERGKLNSPAAAAKTLESLSEQYPSHPEAPEALYDAAGIYEGDLKDMDKAVAMYKKVAQKFPSSKLAGKATQRAAKLEAK